MNLTCIHNGDIINCHQSTVILSFTSSSVNSDCFSVTPIPSPSASLSPSNTIYKMAATEICINMQAGLVKDLVKVDTAELTLKTLKEYACNFIDRKVGFDSRTIQLMPQLTIGSCQLEIDCF
ncbi:Serine/threonine-protein kinase D1 [Dermatophagoides farinae]|uniref:Serine/threonine-protein kinase D1 n=1 Tax=Dermatophagoides farinae TaxID=6954 RepID=A0A922KYS8_DERFA|nr:Serine/threonine-protein kinase D1 [Dermatophagoides farinae]